MNGYIYDYPRLHYYMYMILNSNGASVKSIRYIPEATYNSKLHITRRVNVLFIDKRSPVEVLPLIEHRFVRLSA